MAMAIREPQQDPRRAAPMRTRTHGGSATRALAAIDAARTGASSRPLAGKASGSLTGTRLRFNARGNAAEALPRGARPMVKVTAGVMITPAPPSLAVVPRRRRTARLIAVGFATVFALMFVAAAFQTQLAQRQLELDKTDRAIRDANEEYSRLRRERAELRSPGRLVTEATAIGMKPATDTTFMDMSPDVVATIQQSSGGVFDAQRGDVSSLEEFMAVKAVAGAMP